MYTYALAIILDTCPGDCDEPQPIAINTLTGEIECETCGAQGVLGQHELLEILNNLED